MDLIYYFTLQGETMVLLITEYKGPAQVHSQSEALFFLRIACILLTHISLELNACLFIPVTTKGSSTKLVKILELTYTTKLTS